MEGRQRAGDARALGRLVPAHIAAAPHHVEVELPAQGIVQGREVPELFGEVVGVHWLKSILEHAGDGKTNFPASTAASKHLMH